MYGISLAEEDVAAVNALVDDLARRHHSVESAEFQQESRAYAEELPRRLRQAINEYRLTERSGTLVISGLPVDDESLGSTPPDRRDTRTSSASHRHDIAFYLVAALLGEPIGWATQQDGLIMHDIFPIKKYEHDQIGWGSAEDLTWHTEDAFHPLRTDYLGLMCLRNPDGVETTIAEIADVELDSEVRALLSEKRFFILPDDSHRPQNSGAHGPERDSRVAELRMRSRRVVEKALSEPEPIAVLFGDPRSPYVRVDPHYMQGAQGDIEQTALEKFCAAIDSVLAGVVLKPGDMCFLDNYRVVHGRKPFRARFDGTDRWLRRLNVTRDLRKSREFRIDAGSRVIY
ncbi:guanitoxin biosynthesis L-enduracididine beta-hydroxylase GntD [Sphaerisporangium sp. NPDC051017]|uniref:guanitoxin biosynthesis L-enduracididine beta-hydroxylase GntD n=1 Tax=Sphaerisporangium sp. NPDC051017 TaxID=3154636 RepID=UPI0034389BA9